LVIFADYSGVSLKLGQLHTLHGAAAKLLRILLVIPMQDFVRIEPACGKARFERWIKRFDGFAVPRADVLTNIAAVKPLADLRFDCFVDLTAMFNGEIRDAFSRIKLVGRGIAPVGQASRQRRQVPQRSFAL